MKDTARFFKVLADEARLKMLWLLFNHQELCVCDFVAALGITQSKASRHLRTLWHGGLVTDRRDGLWCYYAIRPVDDEIVRQHLGALRANLAGRADAAPLLAKLHACIETKDRGVVCLDGPCAVSKKKSKGRAAKARAARRPRA